MDEASSDDTNGIRGVVGSCPECGHPLAMHHARRDEGGERDAGLIFACDEEGCSCVQLPRKWTASEP